MPQESDQGRTQSGEPPKETRDLALSPFELEKAEECIDLLEHTTLAGLQKRYAKLKYPEFPDHVFPYLWQTMLPEWLAENLEKLHVIFPTDLEFAIGTLLPAKDLMILHPRLLHSILASPNPCIRRIIAAKPSISFNVLTQFLSDADDQVKRIARSAYEVRPELAAEKSQQGLVPYHGVYLAPQDSETLATLEHAAGAPLCCSNAGYQFPIEEGGAPPTAWGGIFSAMDGRVVDLAYGSKCQNFSALSELGKLSGLKNLKINIPENEKFPAELGQLYALERLDLRRKRLTRVPDFLQELRSLQFLDLGQNHLTTLPAFLPRLPLIALDLSENKLGDPLPILGEISSLTILRIGGNRARSILDREADFIRGLSRLSNLRILGAGSIGLNGEIPPEIARWSKLEVLDISLNAFNSLPESIGDMPALTFLNLLGNENLDTLPRGILRCPSLRQIDLDKHLRKDPVVYELQARGVKVNLNSDRATKTGFI